LEKKKEIHKKFWEYRQKRISAYEQTKDYYTQDADLSYSPLNAAVYDTLNESRRQTKDFMERLSNASHSQSPTPTNRNSFTSRDLNGLNFNIKKKVR